MDLAGENVPIAIDIDHDEEVPVLSNEEVPVLSTPTLDAREDLPPPPQIDNFEELMEAADIQPERMLQATTNERARPTNNIRAVLMANYFTGLLLQANAEQF